MSMDAPRLYLITPPITDWTVYPPFSRRRLQRATWLACFCEWHGRRRHGGDGGPRAYSSFAKARRGLPRCGRSRIGAPGQCRWRPHRRRGAIAAICFARFAAGPHRRRRRIADTRRGDDRGRSGRRLRDVRRAWRVEESHESIVARVAWWAEIFNVPCVGYAHHLGGIGDLVRAGADFIALGDAVFADPRGAGTALRDAARFSRQPGISPMNLL